MATLEIAELIVPSDGLGAPTNAVIDWPRGKIYLSRLISQTPGTVRVYDAALVTQNPIMSVTLENGLLVGDVDPLTGGLVFQGGAFGAGNQTPVNKYDPTTLARTGTFGVYSSLGTYPGGIDFSESLVCVGVGTQASGGASQVTYALLKASAFSGAVGVIRVDNMTAAGFNGNVVSNGTDNRGAMCAGASGPTRGSVFLTDSDSPQSSIHLYTVVILPGAETYNIASWPTTNPFISSATVGTIVASAIDPTWTAFSAFGIGYDAVDGNVLIDVRHTAGVAIPRYIIKVDSATAAVIWAAPNLSAVGAVDEFLPNYRVAAGSLTVRASTASNVINAATGGVTSTALGGVLAPDGISPAASTAGDDVSGLMLLDTQFTEGANSPTPVAGTPASFTGWAIMGVPPPPPRIATMADLWFSNTGSFIDPAVVLNRRKFVDPNGCTAYLGTDGSIPTGLRPAVFLTVLPGGGNAADTFALNRGVGGTFSITGGDLALAGTAPCCGVAVQVLSDNHPQGADPQVRLSTSDDGGRTWSTLKKWRSMGKIGRYRTRLRWLKLGKFRQRIIKLEITDPVRRNIVGFYQDTSEGMG